MLPGAPKSFSQGPGETLLRTIILEVPTEAVTAFHSVPLIERAQPAHICAVRYVFRLLLVQKEEGTWLLFPRRETPESDVGHVSVL